jgi:hypothetical protein
MVDPAVAVASLGSPSAFFVGNATDFPLNRLGSSGRFAMIGGGISDSTAPPPLIGSRIRMRANANGAIAAGVARASGFSRIKARAPGHSTGASTATANNILRVIFNALAWANG